MKQDSIFGFDFLLLGATLGLVAIGVLFIYSSSFTSTGERYSQEYVKQLVWAASGVVLMLAVTLLNYNRLRGYSLYLYALVVLLLLVTPLVGREVNGSRSWLGFGEVGFQPSEFAKIATILFLGAYFSGIGNGIRELPRFLLGLGIALLPMGLVLLQPDMGTALVFIPIFLTMGFMAGARLRHLFFIFAVLLLMVVFAALPVYEKQFLGRELSLFGLSADSDLGKVMLASLALVTLLAAWGAFGFKRRYFYWMLYVCSLLLASILGSFALSRVLKGYQMMRLIIFLNPRLDAQGAGWNILQSITAVGSGGFWGKGLLQGTQSHYRFIPQQRTDFIFSILAEEWGFLGAMLVLALFLLILIRGLRIVYTAKDEFALYIGAGIVGMIFFHVVVNIGMTMGIMPITGIPLFFVSYGGSSLWTALIGIGLLHNIAMRRYRY